MNDTLKSIHDLLITQVGALSRAYDATTDREIERAIAREITETVHRANVLQNLLFVCEANALDGMLPAVRNADAELTHALASVTNRTEVIKGVSNLLALVDKAIDVGKTFASLSA